MDSNHIYEVAIVGGGICGLATALALRREGIESIVFEKSKTLRATGAAIIMQPNGWRALDHLGVASVLRGNALCIESGSIVSIDDGRRFDLPVGGGEVRCLRRTELMEALAEQLSCDVVCCGRGVVSLQTDSKTSHTILQIDDGSTITAKIVIGCDGVNSVVADTLKLNSMKHSSTCVIRGFTHYENGHDFLPMFPIWSSESVTYGHLPVTDKLVYWFVTRILTCEDSRLSGDQELIKYSALASTKGFPQHVSNLIKNCDVSSLHLTSLKYRPPWDLLTTNFRKGKVIVIGDAMHAMGPFLAQGGAICLEDAVILAKCLSKELKAGTSGLDSHGTIEQALDHFLERRKRRVFWISLQTYLGDLRLGTASKLLKVLGVFLLLVLFRDPIAHTNFDCVSV